MRSGRCIRLGIGIGILSILMPAMLIWWPGLVLGQGAGAQVNVPVPAGVNFFNLSLQQTRAFSRSKNFAVVGHSYFKGPWLTPSARAAGLGAGFNSLRVDRGIAYLAGYNGPPTLFATLIADIHDPANMKPLATIPCNPGTRCAYLRLNTTRHVLVIGHDTSPQNPQKATSGQLPRAGFSFVDVSDPAKPVPLGFILTQEGGQTHGFDIDDRYVYGCATVPESKPGAPGNHEVVIIDYQDPAHPKVVGSVHIQGQHVDEEFAPQDQRNPDGTPQHVWCHEIIHAMDRLYVAWRDAGVVILDVRNPAEPRIISRLDYVPPFKGGALGAAHTAAPVIVNPAQYPKLLVLTDEIFECPPGFGRIVDISDLAHPMIISSYRIPFVHDTYNAAAGKFVCPPGSNTAHLLWFDYRSPGLFYNAWYVQGLRAWDISDPFLPREAGYYLSPPYPCEKNCGGAPGHSDRHTREVFQDRTTGLLYMTDGDGGGLTVLRWTGPIPRPPIPGAR